MLIADIEKISEAFLEISSQQRLEIINILAEKRTKLSALAKELDATSSEIHRNLNRLIKSKIISKDVDGLYYLTTYGKMIYSQISAWILFLNNSKYFEKHNFGNLDAKIVQSIGALSNSKHIKGFVKVQEQWKKIYKNSKEYLYNILYEVSYDTEILETISKMGKKKVELHSIFSDLAIVSDKRMKLLEKYGITESIKKELMLFIQEM